MPPRYQRPHARSLAPASGRRARLVFAAMTAATPYELSRKFARAINESDLTGALALWGEGSVIITAAGESVGGIDAIAGVLGALIDSGTTVEIDVTSVHEAGGVALATGSLTMRAPDGATLRSSSVVVYARDHDGSWQVAIDAPWGLPQNGSRPAG
jgi:ketosteroid isomerase-like protein